MTSLLHGLLSLRGWPAYLIVASLCFGESAIFVGFVLPGEIAVVYGGVLASRGHVSLFSMTGVVVAAAVLGYTAGYAVGKYLGPVLLRHRPLKDSEHVARTQALFQRRGAVAVFLGRFLAVFRALVPGMAGMAGVRFRVFLVFDILSGVLWGIGYTVGGYLAGKSYERLLSVAGTATYAVIGVAAVVGAALFVRARRRRRRHALTEVEGRPLDSTAEIPD